MDYEKKTDRSTTCCSHDGITGSLRRRRVRRRGDRVRYGRGSRRRTVHGDDGVKRYPAAGRRADRGKSERDLGKRVKRETGLGGAALGKRFPAVTADAGRG